MANSVSYRGAQRAGSLTEAILRLGMRDVYRHVMEIVTAPALKTPDAFTYGRVDLWRHSLATAVAAHTLARNLTEEDPEVVFTAALLHDIGKALLGRVAGADYFKLLNVCAETNRAVHAAEQEAFRADHTEAAGRLLRAWKFPQGIVAAVAGHHWPAKLGKGHQPVAALVYAGNILAYRIGQGNGFPMYAVHPDEAVLQIIGVENDDLAQHEEEIGEMLRREQAQLR